jgi:hypothetical protein
MSRKDYQLIAHAMRAGQPEKRYEDHYDQWEYDCRSLARVLCETNPRFDGNKFLTACGAE